MFISEQLTSGHVETRTHENYCPIMVIIPPDAFRQVVVIPNSVDGKNDEKECVLVFCILGAAPLTLAWIFMFS